jgi:hypothetical protein
MIFPPKSCKEDVTWRSFFSWIKRGWELCRATKAHLRVRIPHLWTPQCHRKHPKIVLTNTTIYLKNSLFLIWQSAHPVTEALWKLYSTQASRALKSIIQCIKKNNSMINITLIMESPRHRGLWKFHQRSTSYPIHKRDREGKHHGIQLD